jgi:hypothetical protein
LQIFIIKFFTKFSSYDFVSVSRLKPILKGYLLVRYNYSSVIGAACWVLGGNLLAKGIGAGDWSLLLLIRRTWLIGVFTKLGRI